MKDNIKNIVVTISFFGFLFIFLIINIFKNDTLISSTERRKLALFPKISIDSLFNGEFANDFDKYSMDQFVGRDSFRKLKTTTELNIFRKKDVNNVYLKDGMLIKTEYPLNEKSVSNFIKKINRIKDNYLDSSNNVYYSVIPDKNYFVSDDNLKLNYDKLLEELDEGFSDINYIDLFDILNLNDYYLTDTHWKQTSLDKVANKISVEMGFNKYLSHKFDIKDVTAFNGVLSGQMQVKTEEDRIKILTNDVINQAKVYNLEKQKYEDVYNMEKLSELDKYDIYLSGATPVLYIENNLAQNDKQLVVFRDSFGSSLIPLIIEGYKHITVVDIRYISTDYLISNNYVEFTDKDILFLYSTLVINSSLALK